MKHAGFTLIELLISIAIIATLVAAALPLYSGLQISAQLNESAEQIIGTLRLARTLSVERKYDSSHGIFFDANPAGSDRIILFAGASYATRNPSYDRATVFDSALALSPSLSGGAVEVVFSRATGFPSAIGTIQMLHATSGIRTISINSAGTIEQN